MHTLQDVSYHRSYKAERGDHGKGSTKTGKNGEDLLIQIPLGTVVTDTATGRVLLDCIEAGKRFLIAKGGRGGRGNAALACRADPNPERCEAGKAGEELSVRLTLKVLADVGLVGRPNAGKSTFLATVSKARPKIADYPFTTTQPNLGIVTFGDNQTSSLVIADIPGLIEDSHLGKGLGIRFLKHIERTSILAIMVEATSEDPLSDARVLHTELQEYSPALARKPFCYILTKTDLLSEDCETTVPDGWLSMSAVSGEGVERVLQTLKGLYEKHRPQTVAVTPEEEQEEEVPLP
jgi:GTP-binding protein